MRQPARLLQHTTTFQMTSNGFLLISNRREIKISVVSLTRETARNVAIFLSL